jgi:UDP-4-amino-4,6-dideoxy-N-acetyl-beta-L-altrosamine N-acetyltransferase
MLKGKKISMRPLRFSDWEKTLKWRNDFTIKKLAMMHPFPITEMVEKEWYENILKSKNETSVYFTIIDYNDNPVGFINLNKINRINRNCFLGIVIGDSETRGMGYGEDAMKVITQYAFNQLNLLKISVEVVANNETATKLYTKLGFIEEGRLKHQFFSEGNYYDVLILSLFNI